MTSFPAERPASRSVRWGMLLDRTAILKWRVMTASAGDHPGVHLPPPLFRLAAIGGGAVLRRYLPLTIGWDAPRMIAAWTFIALFAGLTAWSFIWFARQRTTIIPNKPANALV